MKLNAGSLKLKLGKRGITAMLNGIEFETEHEEEMFLTEFAELILKYGVPIEHAEYLLNLNIEQDKTNGR